MEKAKIEELLNSCKGLAEKLKNSPPLPKEFWEKQAEILKKSGKERKRIEQSLKMSYEKLHQKFNI